MPPSYKTYQLYDAYSIKNIDNFRQKYRNGYTPHDPLDIIYIGTLWKILNLIGFQNIFTASLGESMNKKIML